MSALSKRVAQIESQFGAEAAAAWRKYHIAAQLARLVSGVAGSVAWTALHSGVHDWTGLVPVATTALWATLAEIWPQVPWLLLRNWSKPAPKYATGGYIPAPAGATAGTYPGPSWAPKTVGDVLSGGAAQPPTPPPPGGVGD